MAYPAPFLEPAAERFTDLLVSQVNRPIDISNIAPGIANVNPLIQQAQQRTATAAGLGSLQFDDQGAITGVGEGTGIASYQPFLDRAGQDLASARGLIGPDAYKQFQSPYQREVIDATQALLNEQRAAGRSQLANTAISAGAFGGGREGVARAEYERGRDISDAGIISELRQKGFEQANQLARQAQQDFLGSASAQLGLAQGEQGLSRGLTGQLGSTGAGALQYSQSLLDAQRAKNLLNLEYPLQRIQSGIGSLGTLTTGSQAYQQPLSPILTNPGIAGIQGLAGVYGLFRPPQARQQ